MGGSKNREGNFPPKWMVYFMEKPLKKWDDLGVPLFLETPRSIYIYISGQIIATSHDRFPPNGGLVREITLYRDLFLTSVSQTEFRERLQASKIYFPRKKSIDQCWSRKQSERVFSERH